jgi:uncharacterized protein
MEVIRLLALAAGGAAIGWALRIPSGEMIGAMVATGAWSLSTGRTTDLPEPLFTLALVLLGAQLGSKMTRETLGQLGRAGPVALGIIVALIAIGLGLAFVMTRFAGLGFRDALFSTSPGAMSAVVGMSAQAGANAVLVASFHVLRIVLVTASLPLLLRLAR